MDQARVLMKYDPAISFLTKLMRVLVLLAGGYGVIHGRITLGVLTAFMEYTSKITWPIENVGWLGNCFASAIASNKKLNKILAEEPQIAEPENPVELSKLPGDLEFHHVDFSLHDTPILQDIDFTLKQGHTLGIMGMTGSGKQPSSICSSVLRCHRRLHLSRRPRYPHPAAAHRARYFFRRHAGRLPVLRYHF